MLERLFLVNPLVTDNPLQLPTVETASGVVEIPFTLSLPANLDPALRLFVNGDESAMGEVVQDAGSSWRARLDTFGLASGLCSLQIGLFFNDQSGHQRTAAGIPAFTTINNIISVNPLTRMFIDTLHIEAAANIAANNYAVEVRDSAGTLLKTLTGSVQSGLVVDTWNLQDAGGNVIVSGPLQVTFSLNNGGTPVASAPVKFNLLKHITGQAFAIAYGDHQPLLRADLAVSRGVVDILDTGFEPDDYILLPHGYNDPYSDNPFAWSYDGSNTATLTDALADPSCGNFFWLGHGYSDVQRIHITPSETRDVRLRPSEIATLLGNQGQQGNGVYNNHPYRLVILNGCQSWALEWAMAWGLPMANGENTKAQWTSYGLDACAFVGWKDTFGANPVASLEYGECLGELFGNWRANSTLRECLNAYTAKWRDDFSGVFSGLDSWRIAGCGDLRTQDR